METLFSQILLEAHFLCMLKTFFSPLFRDKNVNKHNIKRGFLKKEGCIIEGLFMIMLERIFESYK